MSTPVMVNTTQSSPENSIPKLHLAVFLFGWPGLFAKWITLSPVFISFGRTTFAALTLGIILLAKRQSFRIPSRRQLISLLAAGTILVVHWSSFFHAVQVSSVALAVITSASAPIFSLLIERFALREDLHRDDLVVACVAVGGIAILVSGSGLGNGTLAGVFFGLVTGLTFAILGLMNRSLITSLSSLLVMFYENLVAAVILSTLYWNNMPVVTVRDIWLIALLGVVFTAGSHTIFVSSLQTIRVSTAQTIANLSPIYQVVLAMIFLGEIPTIRIVVGGIVTLTASLYATSRLMRRTGAEQ